MRKNHRLPREQAAATGDDVPGPINDGLNLDQDVEGHGIRTRGEFAPRLPGTGGDFRRPTGSGELVGEDDGEGHRRP